MSLIEQVLSPIPGDPLGALRRTDRLWQKVRQNALPLNDVITESLTPLTGVDWDVVICGGTLGIFLGATLVQQGWRVALLEKGSLRGRDQEWNISRKELMVFVELGLLSETELNQAIASAYNPVRISFHQGAELWVRDVLNIGVDPVFLLATLKSKFLSGGGTLLEHTTFDHATIHPNGVELHYQTSGSAVSQTLTARLLLDAMGHFSQIVRQARQSQQPDAVCLVVGTCANGFPHNDNADLIATITPIQHQCQYFWEAFPARDGRTTYLFTYLDAHPDRLSLEFLFEEYLRLLPTYQQVALEQLQVQRALFGLFPCYRHSPLGSTWNRVMHVGDSSGSQSPLSFGGFGAMVRHLPRLSQGIDQVLKQDSCDRTSLSQLQPYQPNLAVTWLFQKTMSVGIDQKVPPNQINDLLSAVFSAMQTCGDPILKPFLQDVVQFPALSQALLKTTQQQPGLVLSLVPQLGLPNLLDWTRHYLNLGTYAALDRLANQFGSIVPPLSDTQQAVYQRWRQAWKYGSGGDF